MIQVKTFLKLCKNTGVKWSIDGVEYKDRDSIPEEILQKQLYEWIVFQWDGIISILTCA